MRRAIIGVALVAAVAGRFVIVAAGQAASCTPSGGLSFICGVQNAEDLVLVPNTRWLVASGMAPGSGLHIVDTRAKTARNIYAVGTSTSRPDKTKYANCPAPLDPKLAVLHGLSLRAAANG